MISSHIKETIQAALGQMHVSVEEIGLQHPDNPQFGDYSTNIAFQLSKQLQKPPLAIAEEIASHIAKTEGITKVEVVKPGFINFWLSPELLLKETAVIAQTQEYGKQAPTNKKIIMEFGQPNTHKLPHIGHLFSYIYGESMARILQYQGNTVYRANYQGDIGLHVAKCLWQVLKDEAAGTVPRDKTLEDRVQYLQKYYQIGATAYEENEQAKQEIDQLNKKIYADDPAVHAVWQETRQWSLDFYTQLETRLGITYDKKYFETMSAPLGKQAVLDNVGKVFVEDDGAIIFRGEEYGQHTRVFINKFGNPTYEGKDTGLIQLKMKDFDFDLSLTSTAVEQKKYWDTVNTACELMFPELKGKLGHIDFGMINLSTGKMSSRTGNIIDAIGLLEIVKEEIRQAFEQKDETTIESVSQASIKYSFLKSEVYKNKAFDLKSSISKEGDSGPYLLYTYVRTKSILEKAGLETGELSDVTPVPAQERTPEESALIRKLYQLPEVVALSAQQYSQHTIAKYLFDVAQLFNLFYQKNPILKADDTTKKTRLLITKATSNILHQGLHLLGIQTVEKM